MLSHYVNVLVFSVLAMGMGCVPLLMGYLLGPRAPDSAKCAPYECGFDAFSGARMPFDVRFYLVAILFIIFDLETAFLFPWAVVVRKIGLPGMISMGLFLGLLMVGFIFEWRRGALTWE